jgi:serine/threonine-protein kinase
VNEDDYLGRPADEVAAELRSKGLEVTTQPVTTDEYDPGTVTNVSPTGNLSPGDTVTLSVARAAPTTSTPSETPSQSPSSTSPSSTTTEPTTSPTTSSTDAAAEDGGASDDTTEAAG